MKKRIISLFLAIVMMLAEAAPALAQEADAWLGFRASQTVGEVTVTVQAPAGVFPEDAVLRVLRVQPDDADAEAIGLAVENACEQTRQIVKSFACDIQILDGAGNEIQPNIAFGKPEITFKTASAKNEALSAEVYHIAENAGDLTAEALETVTKRGKVSVETEGFSYYVVAFTYETLSVNITNYSPIPLEQLLERLGLEIDIYDVTDYISSDAAVADIEEVEFVDEYGDSYDALAVDFFSEGTADLTLYVDEGGEEDAAYTFSVAVALRDEQDIEGTNTPTQPEQPDQPGGDISDWDGYYTVDKPYTGSVKPEDIGFSVEVGSYSDYSFDGERRGEIDDCIWDYNNESSLFDYAFLFTKFTLNGEDFTLSEKYSGCHAEDSFPTGMDGVQIMPFQNVVATDQDLTALHFNDLCFSDGKLYFYYEDQRGQRLQEQYYYTEYEDDYEYYGWIKDHNLYTNHHDGIDLKMIYGYLIVDAEGNYGYVVTDESQPVHFEIKNLQPDPLSFSPGYSIGVSIGATKEQIAEAIMEESYLSNADNGPYTLHISGDVNTTDVSGLYKYENFWGYYNGSYRYGIPAYQLSIPQLYLKDKDGKVVWTYTKVSDEIPCYDEWGDSYTLYLVDPKDVPDDGGEEEGIYAGFLFGTDGRDEYGQTLSSERILLSEDKALIDEYNTHKISGGGSVNAALKAKKDDGYMLGLVDDDTLIDYLKDHVYVYEETSGGEYSLNRFDPDRVELNEEECWNYPVDWDEMDEPSSSCELCFDLFDEQGKVIGCAYIRAMLLKPVSAMSVTLGVEDGAGGEVWASAETFYVSGMEEPECWAGELRVSAGVQNNAASQLIAFLKNEYDWKKFFTEGLPGEAFRTSIEVRYMNGLVNIGGAKAGGGEGEESASCLAGVQLSNRLNVSGRYDENGKPIADKVSVTETHELPLRLSTSFDPNTAGIYNIGITPMPENKADQEMAVSVKVQVFPAGEKAVVMEEPEDLTIYPALGNTAAKLQILLGTVEASDENGTRITPTMTVTDGAGKSLTLAELAADLAPGKTYTVEYTATHKKDPTVTETVSRTLTVEAATVSFSGIETALTLSAGKTGDLMMALREGVSAKDNDGTTVDFTVSLPEGFTGAAGEYTVTYTAVQPVTQETITATRALTVSTDSEKSAATIKLQDANKADFTLGNFVLGATGQESFILRTDWTYTDTQSQPSGSVTVKVHLPMGFEIGIPESTSGSAYTWSTTGSYKDANGSVVTLNVPRNATSFNDEMGIKVHLDVLYPALKNGYNTYAFTAQSFVDGKPSGDCSGAAFTLECKDALLNAANTQIATGTQSFSPVQLFGTQVAYPPADDANFRMSELAPYVITVNKTANALPDPDWKLRFALPEGMELLPTGDYSYGAKLSMKDNKGATIASGIVTPTKEKDGTYTLPLYTADRYSFAEMSDGKTYMDAVRSAATVEVALYFNSKAMNGTDAVKVNFPGAASKAANTAKEQVKLYNGGTTAAATGDPVSIELNNPTGSTAANNGVSELSLTSMLAQYDGYSNVGNGTLENAQAPIGKNLVQMIFPTLDDVTYKWDSYDTVTNSYNLYQNMTATAEYPYELSPVAVNLCGIDALNGKPNCTIDYVVSKTGAEDVTKTLSINKAFKSSSSSTDEVAFEVNRDAGEYVSKVIVKWGNQFTTMSRNWNNRTYAMNSSTVGEVHICAPYVSVIMAAKSAHADGTAVANDTSVKIKTTLSARDFTQPAKEQTVTLIPQNDRVKVFAYDESYNKVALYSGGNRLYAYFATHAKNTTLEETNVSFIATGELVKYIDWKAPYSCWNVDNYSGAQVVAYSVSENATTKGVWGDPDDTWVTDPDQVMDARLNDFAGLELTGVIVDASKVKFTNHTQSSGTDSYIYYATKPLDASNPYYQELVDKVGEDGYAMTYEVGFHSDNMAKHAKAYQYDYDASSYVEKDDAVSKTYTIVDPWKPTEIGNKGGTDYILNPLAGDANQYDIDQMELVRLRVTDTDFKGDSRGYGYTNGLTYTFEPKSDSAEDQALLNLVEGVAIKGDDYYRQSAIVTYAVRKTDGTMEERVADYNYDGEYWSGGYQYPFKMTETTKHYYYSQGWKLKDTTNQFIPLDLDKGEYVTKLSVTFPKDTLAHYQYMNSVGLVRFNPVPKITGAGYTLPVGEEAAAKLNVNATLCYRDYKDREVRLAKNLASDAKVCYQEITKEITGYAASVNVDTTKLKKGSAAEFTFTNKVTYGDTAARLGTQSTVPACFDRNTNWDNKLGDQHNNELRPTFYYVVDKDYEYVAASVTTDGVTARFYPDAYANGDGLLAVSYGDSYRNFSNENKAETFSLRLRPTIEADGKTAKAPIKAAYMDVSRDVKDSVSERGYALAVGTPAGFPAEITAKDGNVQGLAATGELATAIPQDGGLDKLSMVPTTTAADGAYEKNDNPGTTITGTAELRFGLDGEAIAMTNGATNYNIYIPVLKTGETVTVDGTDYTQELDNVLSGADAVKINYQSGAVIVKYTTKQNPGFEGNSPTDYVEASQITDWSKVTGIYIHADSISKTETLKYTVRFAAPEKTLVGTQLGYGFAYYASGETQTSCFTSEVNTFELQDYLLSVNAANIVGETAMEGIKVTVTDKDGNAIGSTDDAEIEASGATTEEGTLTLAVPAPGAYILHVTREGTNDLTEKGEASDFGYVSGDSDVLTVDALGEITLGDRRLSRTDGAFGPIRVGIVSVTIEADDFEIGVKTGETLTEAQAIRFAHAGALDRSGEPAELHVDAESLRLVNEALREVGETDETVKLPIRFCFDAGNGFQPNKDVAVIIRPVGTAMPTGNDQSYLCAQDFRWPEKTTLSASNAKKLAFVAANKADGSACSMAGVKVNESQLNAINADIAKIKAGETVGHKSYPLTFTAGSASATVHVTLENTSKKGTPGLTEFLTNEKTIVRNFRDGTLNAPDVIRLANFKGIDADGLILDLSGLQVNTDELETVNDSIRSKKTGKFPVHVTSESELEIKLNALVTDDFRVVFSVNGATNRGAKDASIADVTWGVDTVTIPDVTLVKELGAKSYSFVGWALSENGAVLYDRGATLTVDQVKKLYQSAKATDGSDIKTATLYASWKKIPGTGYIDVNITAEALNGVRDMNIALEQDGIPAVDPITGTLDANGYVGRFEGLDGGTYTMKVKIGRVQFEQEITIAKNGSSKFAYAFEPEIIYTLEFDGLDEEPRTCIVGESITLPTMENPDDPNFVLIGWKNEATGQTHRLGKPVTDIYTGDAEGVTVTLVPVWQPPCTVTLQDGETTVTKTVKYGEVLKLEAPSAKENYTFRGWKYCDVVYSAGTDLRFGEAAEATLTADWKENTNTVTFDPNGGICVRTGKELGVVTAETFGTLPNPTHPYAVFDGWYDAQEGGNRIESSTEAPASDCILYAHWKDHKTFTVTENGEGKENAATYGTDFNFTVSDPDKTYDVSVTIGGKTYYGAEFNAETGTYTIPGEDITGEIAITSEPTDENYTVLTFRFDGKVVYTAKVLKDSTYPTAEEVTLPTKTGYIVTGWFTDEECTQEATGTVGEEKTLYAKAEKKRINVTFGDGEPTGVQFGDAISFPENPYDTATQKFLGWKGSNGVVIPKADSYSYTMPDVDALTFEPIWQEIGALTITVRDTNGAVEGATVNLMRSGTVVCSALTNDRGNASFSGLDYGAYNISVISSINETETVTTTVGKDIQSGKTNVTVTVPTVKLNTVVEATEVEMNITSENLEKAIRNNEKPAADGSTEVTITLKAAAANDTDKQEIDDQVSADAGSSAAQVQMVDYVDLTVTKKTVTDDGAGGTETQEDILSTTDDYQVISVEISDKLYAALKSVNGSPENIVVYHHHRDENGSATVAHFTKVKEEHGNSTKKDCYWVKTVAGKSYIVIKTRNFSAYAFGVQDKAVEAYEPETPVISGGGSATYPISGASTENGTVTLSSKKAAAGKIVTITVTPDEGYQLDTLTVTDARGNVLTLTKLNDTTYTFTMPSSKVSISASFTKITVCPRDASCPIEPFADTENDFWWHDGIHYCIENGLMQGVGDDLFDPNGTLTRAQIVTILWRMEEKPVVNYAMSFEDVPEGEWYSEPIRWAQSTGVVLGYSDEAFGPSDNVTREQLAAILMRYAAYRGIDVSERADLAAFTDVGEISAWALENVKWANAVGLIKGRTDTTIVPIGTATRAEAATMVQRFCENVLKK